ncbi:MAG: hypothetical protein ACXABY_36415, partial [Candidatus Thorarchaeota archaeon]
GATGSPEGEIKYDTQVEFGISIENLADMEIVMDLVYTVTLPAPLNGWTIDDFTLEWMDPGGLWHEVLFAGDTGSVTFTRGALSIYEYQHRITIDAGGIPTLPSTWGLSIVATMT